MLLRNALTGEFEVYDIRNNVITSASSLGRVGIDWLVAGFGPISATGHSDMVLRNALSGAFEVYDIANNQITASASLGAAGQDWLVAGIGGNSQTPLGPSLSGSSQSAQLVQAMAGFGGDGGGGRRYITTAVSDNPAARLSAPGRWRGAAWSSGRETQPPERSSFPFRSWPGIHAVGGCRGLKTGVAGWLTAVLAWPLAALAQQAGEAVWGFGRARRSGASDRVL
jgi:hypothetical protein